MTLYQALICLAREWERKVDAGAENISTNDQMVKRGSKRTRALDSPMDLAQVAAMIERVLQEAGRLETAERFVARFKSEKELLRATSLFELVFGATLPNEEDGSPENTEANITLQHPPLNRLDYAHVHLCPAPYSRIIYAQEQEAIEEATEIIAEWIASRPIVHNMSISEQLYLYHQYLLRHEDNYSQEQLECLDILLRYARIR